MIDDLEETERDVMRFMLCGAPLSYCRLSPDERRADAQTLIKLARRHADASTSKKLAVLTELRSMLFFLADDSIGYYWLSSQDETPTNVELTGNC